jgi:succinyl-CoA synthetase alpha subunit
MAVPDNEHTSVICQGVTGGQGTFNIELVNAYGTKMVGGMTGSKALGAKTVWTERG